MKKPFLVTMRSYGTTMLIIFCPFLLSCNNDDATLQDRTDLSSYTSDISALSDSFDDLNLNSWKQLHVEEGWANNIKSLSVDKGVLNFQTHTCGWYADFHGAYLYKEVEGNFDVKVKINVTGQHADIPSVEWSLAGLMARKPSTLTKSTWEAGQENYVFITTGIAEQLNTPVYETKTTVNSSSTLNLISSSEGYRYLRIVRINSSFFLLTKEENQTNWVLRKRFNRNDLPPKLQLGYIAYTGWNSVRELHNKPFEFNSTEITNRQADIVVLIDYITFMRPDELAISKVKAGASEMEIVSALGD